METIAGGKTPGLCLVEALPAEVVALGISICDARCLPDCRTFGSDGLVRTNALGRYQPRSHEGQLGLATTRLFCMCCQNPAEFHGRDIIPPKCGLSSRERAWQPYAPPSRWRVQDIISGSLNGIRFSNGAAGRVARRPDETIRVADSSCLSVWPRKGMVPASCYPDVPSLQSEQEPNVP